MTVHDDATALVERTTGAQGLPPTVTDAGALERVATLLRAELPTAPGTEPSRRPTERAA